MLGGSVYFAFLRFSISLAGVILLFSLMSKPRFCRKRQWSIMDVLYFFTCSGLYLVYDWLGELCEAGGIYYVYMLCGIFGLYEQWYGFLSMYKLALTFYLLAVFLIGGIEASMLFFNSNRWADLIIRIVLIVLLAFVIEKYVKVRSGVLILMWKMNWIISVWRFWFSVFCLG